MKFAGALLRNEVTVDTTGECDGVARHFFIKEALVVPEVEVGFGAVLRDVALAMFGGIKQTSVHIEVRVALLHGHF